MIPSRVRKENPKKWLVRCSQNVNLIWSMDLTPISQARLAVCFLRIPSLLALNSFLISHLFVPRPWVIGVGADGIGGVALLLLNQPTNVELFGNMFSYCLSILESSASTRYLVLGKESSTSTSSLQFTTLLKDPSFLTFYYVTLQRISVGDTVISIWTTSIANGGGTIVDSRTMITHLVSFAYTTLKNAFREKLPNL